MKEMCLQLSRKVFDSDVQLLQGCWKFVPDPRSEGYEAPLEVSWTFHGPCTWKQLPNGTDVIQKLSSADNKAVTVQVWPGA